jgi:hypothetical protein
MILLKIEHIHPPVSVSPREPSSEFQKERKTTGEKNYRVSIVYRSFDEIVTTFGGVSSASERRLENGTTGNL